MNINVKKVVELARTWDRKSIHSIDGCPTDTCAFFVRYVFREALHQTGIMSIAQVRPYYSENGIQSLPTNLNFADSFAGDAIGEKVDFSRIQAGDILLFKDTFYSNQFPEGSITHVGIALDNNGLMADSSRGNCFVRNHHIFFPGKLVEARRPDCLGRDAKGVGMTLSKGQVLKSGDYKEIEVKYGISVYEKIYGAKKPSSKPYVKVDGNSFRYEYITIDITTSGGKHIKLYHHDGKTSAFVSEQQTNNLEVVAKLKGGLHVWADGKEIKPASVNIGVS